MGDDAEGSCWPDKRIKASSAAGGGYANDGESMYKAGGKSSDCAATVFNCPSSLSAEKTPNVWCEEGESREGKGSPESLS
jgi:hypothetical protein